MLSRRTKKPWGMPLCGRHIFLKKEVSGIWVSPAALSEKFCKYHLECESTNLCDPDALTYLKDSYKERRRGSATASYLMQQQ